MRPNSTSQIDGESTEALPAQGTNDRVHLWLSTSDSSGRPHGEESAAVNSSSSAVPEPSQAVAPNPLEAVYAALRGSLNDASTAAAPTNGIAGIPAVASDQASLSSDDNSPRPTPNLVAALASAAQAPPPPPPPVEIVSAANTGTSHTWNNLAPPRAGNGAAFLFSRSLGRQTVDVDSSLDNLSADGTDLALPTNPPSLSARSSSGAVNPEVMRNISKVIFADTENASTSPNISDDEASLVSMQQTPLRLHQALTQKEYSGAPKPSNEEGRMEFLCGLKVLDSAPERRYNRLTSTVAKVFNTPIVLVSIVDENRQWFKSVVGLPGTTETDRKWSFCAWTLLPSSPECLIVSDARSDARFRNNKLVTGPPGIQFYGGCPLVSSVGLRMGSFCIIDLHKRFFTAEDCNLLCNCAELAVRELELGRAVEAREFGSADAKKRELREGAAWQRGTLLVHINGDDWVIKFANDCAADVLAISNADQLCGARFWDVFSPKNGSVPNTIQSCRCNLLDASDFEMVNKAFTEEGHKIWVSCRFRSGTQSQLDDDMPIVAVPFDLVSEPATKLGYWFVSLEIATSTNATPLPTPAAFGAAAFGDIFSPSATADISSVLSLGYSLGCQALLSISSAMERRVLHVMEALNPEATVVAVRKTAAAWQKCGVASEALRAPMSIEAGDGAVLLVRPATWPLVTTLRTAAHDGVRDFMRAKFCKSEPACEALNPEFTAVVWQKCGAASEPLRAPMSIEAGDGAVLLVIAAHDGMFRMVPIEKDLYEGTLHLDLPFILDAAAHLTHALTKLHDHGLAHGEVSDATVFVEAKACRSAPMQSWRLGEDAAVSLATLGLGVSTGGAAVPVDAMIEQRPDYLLFFAPERFADELLQPGATGPGDVWCIGVLLCYMLRRSLPLPSFQPMTLLAHLKTSNGAVALLEVDELPVIETLKTLIKLCLSVDPKQRPTAAQLLAALKHIRSSVDRPKEEGAPSAQPAADSGEAARVGRTPTADVRSLAGGSDAANAGLHSLGPGAPAPVGPPDPETSAAPHSILDSTGHAVARGEAADRQATSPQLQVAGESAVGGAAADALRRSLA